jgi:hypothetical protein
MTETHDSVLADVSRAMVSLRAVRARPDQGRHEPDGHAGPLHRDGRGDRLSQEIAVFDPLVLDGDRAGPPLEDGQ